MANPNWTLDETLLALDLYLNVEGIEFVDSDERVQELSRLLRNNPVWEGRRLEPNFRSPAAVIRKLLNLRFAALGRGLAHGSRIDNLIWHTIGQHPEKVRQRAEVIRRAISSQASASIAEIEELEFEEGALVTRQHRHRERDPNLRKKVLEYHNAKGGLRCEICEISYPNLDERLRSAAFEAHHIVPVSMAGEQTIRIEDMALLCATCHRQIHALISTRQDWIDIRTARHILCN